MTVKQITRLYPEWLSDEPSFEIQVSRGNLQQKPRTRSHFGLSAIVKETEEEHLLIRGFEAILKQSTSPITIAHPHYPIELQITQKLGAKNGFLIATGTYIPNFLEQVHEYIKPHHTVLDIGAGAGVSAVLAAKKAYKVFALEPNPFMHSTIEQNAQKNKVNVKVIHGCVTPENSTGTVTFQLMKDPLASSLFPHSSVLDSSIQVQSLPLSALLQETHANALMVDVVGTEISLFEKVNLSTVELIILNIHTLLIGEKCTAHIINLLCKEGFELKDISGSVFVFSK